MTREVALRLAERADKDELLRLALREAGIPNGRTVHMTVEKLSLDARDKRAIRWQYRILLSDEAEKREEEEAPLPPPDEPIAVIGAGPAGLFAALCLARRGLRPMLLERGAPVEERKTAVGAFFAGGPLDPESNVQFGEGGAGAFSDGKLNTQTNSPLNRIVLEELVRFGAPEEILYLGKPHVGSDKLPDVVRRLRSEIERLGGTVRFHCRADGFIRERGRVKGIVTASGERIRTSAVVLAIGHSARDTFRVLFDGGFVLEPKPFAVGLRIEHPQREIDRAQYGAGAGRYPAADYRLASRSADGRGTYTFCMCPGGTVVVASSEAGGLAVNGMSDYARAGENANSALVAEVRREDFGGGPLGGIAFQREIERAAYEAGGGDYRAPVQLVGDFLNGTVSRAFGGVVPTYPRGTAFAPLHEILPSFLVPSLREGIAAFGRRIRGFDRPDAVLTGVETRTSSPVRLVRDDRLTALGAEGLFPAGEGCGYAGGIMSAAADGIRAADAVIRSLYGGNR